MIQLSIFLSNLFTLKSRMEKNCTKNKGQAYMYMTLYLLTLIALSHLTESTHQQKVEKSQRSFQEHTLATTWGKKRRINTKKKNTLKNRLQANPIPYTEDSSIFAGNTNWENTVELPPVVGCLPALPTPASMPPLPISPLMDYHMYLFS